jgi:hypothetical protein
MHALKHDDDTGCLVAYRKSALVMAFKDEHTACTWCRALRDSALPDRMGTIGAAAALKQTQEDCGNRRLVLPCADGSYARNQALLLQMAQAANLIT